jgi:predicted nucleotidyltransferase component of viral defense system
MNEAIRTMLSAYNCSNSHDATNALREILQEIVLLGLWRSKFFEHAAFYGGTALRILYGLDRFSEDLDFSLLETNPDFELAKYLAALEKELNGFGFETRVEIRNKAISSPVQSAFLKTDTLNTLLTISTDKRITRNVQTNQLLKIKIEIDTEPPLGFQTEARYKVDPIVKTKVRQS